MSKCAGSQEDQCRFEGILQGELDLLAELRKQPGSVPGSQIPAYQRASDSHLCGLALSGGGIRSATFSLGAIQALANYGLLQRFDYLSTVSGGGYLGCWLSALLQRKAPGKAADGSVGQASVEAFQRCLKSHPGQQGQGGKHDVDCFAPADSSGFPPVESSAVRFLRRYSNYLSPRLGFSGDMLSVVAIILRNVTLIQLMLISLLASGLLLAHGIAALHMSDRFSDHSMELLIAAAALFLWMAKQGGGLMAERRRPECAEGSAARRVHFEVLSLLFLAAYLFSIAFGRGVPPLPSVGNIPQMLWLALGGALLYTAACIVGYITNRARESASDDSACEDGEPAPVEDAPSIGWRFPRILLSALLCGAILGLLVYAASSEPEQPRDPWLVVMLGPPLFLLALSFVAVLQIGLLRRVLSKEDREWLARLGGFLLLYCAAWILVFALIRYATPAVEWSGGKGLALLASWAGGSGVGVWFARSPKTVGDDEAGGWREWIARLAPWVFVAGLAVLVTFGAQWLLFDWFLDPGFTFEAANDFATADALQMARLDMLPIGGILLALAVSAGIFLALSFFIDINLFSLHAMYRNRLARAYIGASHAGGRRPHPFTGFDPDDDVRFSSLERQRPIPIINTAINMTGGDDLAWQTRRAACFSFTPGWSGYETRSSQGKLLGGYRPTSQYAGGLSLGSLMAVSGAAASPNMGYHTSAAVAALMTAFNLRLGRWCGNPASKRNPGVWKEESPRFAFQPFLAELTGSANADADWINLTDGGHFENLGVYELIRRRCRLIIALDASCDPQYQYEDLANMLRKCWTDFGVNIRFDDFDSMHPRENPRQLQSHSVIGRIQYPGDGEGVLIYMKASMVGDEWPDIRQYADSHKSFPHESTADQFFDEDQFEAYRHLGYKVVAKVVESLCVFFHDHPNNIATDEFVRRMLPRLKKPCLEERFRQADRASSKKRTRSRSD